MIAGGTGIAPIFQIIQSLLTSNVEMTLLFSNVVEEDILLREKLDNFAAEFPQKFKVHYVLTNPSDGWTGLKGRIDEDKIRSLLPPALSTTQVCVCGPISMTNAIDRLLHEMSYSSDMLHLFL
jgi:cytochrome-b5 reductase